jgi:hypothetical protein
MSVRLTADPGIDTPAKDLIGKSIKGFEVHIQFDGKLVPSSADKTATDKINVKVLIKNHSNNEYIYPTDTMVGGPVLVFYCLNTKGELIPLRSPLPPGQVINVGAGLGKIAPGESLEYEESIPTTFLTLIQTDQTIGKMSFFENTGKEPWTNVPNVVWSNGAIFKPEK